MEKKIKNRVYFILLGLEISEMFLELNMLLPVIGCYWNFKITE